jgi:hypothetical protein
MCGAKGFFNRLEAAFNRLQTNMVKKFAYCPLVKEKAQVIGNPGGIDYLGTLAMGSNGNFGTCCLPGLPRLELVSRRKGLGSEEDAYPLLKIDARKP